MNEDSLDPFKNEGFRARLEELRGQQKNGLIAGLQVFQRIEFTAARLPWTFPFAYRTQKGVTFEAFKLRRDPCFRLIVRLWPIYGPGRLMVTAWAGSGVKVLKVIDPDEGNDSRGNR
jgi:hypothetical protein